MPQPTIAAEIERYLRTGDADIDARAWPGDIFDRGNVGTPTCAAFTNLGASDVRNREPRTENLNFRIRS